MLSVVSMNSSPRLTSVQRSSSGIVTLMARALTSGPTSLVMDASSHAGASGHLPGAPCVQQLLHRLAGPGFRFSPEGVADGCGCAGGYGVDGPQGQGADGHVAAADDRAAQGGPDQDPAVARVGAEVADDQVERTVGIMRGAEPAAAGGPRGQVREGEQVLRQGEQTAD